ncbi:Ribosomal protein L22/L17 [Corchorus capsularis]|uniref:Ribosomal protein L22/L17 n=1 Tax=Corchorus capsularis TaxID=210143 RepID=A0A1R3G709_COCAP|nr:Ribosomal protein L22/L17 [Corchorus capsularis]
MGSKPRQWVPKPATRILQQPDPDMLLPHDYNCCFLTLAPILRCCFSSFAPVSGPCPSFQSTLSTASSDFFMFNPYQIIIHQRNATLGLTKLRLHWDCSHVVRFLLLCGNHNFKEPLSNESPKKVNLVAALVRGMRVEDALLQLKVTVKRAAKTVYQNLEWRDVSLTMALAES